MQKLERGFCFQCVHAAGAVHAPDHLTLWGRIGVAPERCEELKDELNWGARSKGTSITNLLSVGVAVGETVHLGQCGATGHRGARWRWLAIGTERPAWDPADQLLISGTGHSTALEAARRVSSQRSLLSLHPLLLRVEAI